MTTFHAVLRTDRGRTRPHNEDAGHAGARLYAVCDGLGGHAAGEVASALAIERLVALEDAQLDSADEALTALVQAIEEANLAILRRAEEHRDEWGMGTTCTAAVAADGRLLLAHVGDSRAYLLRGGEATQLTVDQTPVQALVDAGAISREQARSHPRRAAIDQALGLEETVEVATPDPVLLAGGERLLLCTDGLSEVLDDERIGAMAGAETDLEGLADALVAAALDGGGPDNITVVLVEPAA